MKKLILFSLLFLYSPAFAQLQCLELFKRNSLTARNSSELTTENLRSTLQLDFKSLKTEKHITSITLSADGQWAAIASKADYNPQLDQRKAELLVIDIKTQTEILRTPFTDIKKVFFLPEQKIAVDGTLPSDGKRAQLYVLEIPLQKTTGSQSLATLPQTLSIPQSPHWGVDVSQITPATQSPWFFVSQNSGNSLATLYRPQKNILVSPYTSQLNQGTVLFNSRNGTSLPLVYEGLYAVDVQPHSQHDWVALTVVNPIVAEKGNDSVVIVDTLNPTEPIYKFSFGATSMTLPITAGMDYVKGFKIKNSWSPDGRTLLITEQTTGSVIIYDRETKKEWVSRRNANNYWPLAGSHILSDGQILLIRQGLSPSANGKTRETDLFAYIVNSEGAVRDDSPPRFYLQLSSTPAIEQKNSKIVSVFEMQNGKIITVVFNDQVLLIERQSPHHQTSILPKIKLPIEWPYSTSTINSVQKISESTLRVIDFQNGITDFEIP